MSRKQVTFKCGELTLGGEIWIPDGQVGVPAVVVCHPHPLQGGDMFNGVVTEICKDLEKSGIASLRFNFRGQGISEGMYDGGVGEKDDAKAAISFLECIEEIDKSRIGVAGYSFGAGVGARVAVEDDRVKALALVSPPRSIVDIDSIQGFARPVLCIMGSNDVFIPIADLQDLIERLPGPKQCLIVKGADHFWSYGIDDVATQAAKFFSTSL